jgi:sialate O-acetylesterase
MNRRQRSRRPAQRWQAGLVAAIALLAFDCARADIRLPRILADHMVLQRDAPVSVWGWADPDERVVIEFHGARAVSKADRHGRWSAVLGPFAAGGPFEMTVSGRNRLTMRDILIGDVWLASGQSNMAFPMKPMGDWRTGVNDAEREVASANFPRIRLFGVALKSTPLAQEDVVAKEGGWHAVTPQSVGEFSAIAYLFGRELHQRYQVPIGLIDASWGGTFIESWMSEDSLRPFSEFRKPLDVLARATPSNEAGYAEYVQRKARWYEEHGLDDRGHIAGRDVWAERSFDDSAWLTITEPRLPIRWDDFEGFGAIVWLRKELLIPPELAGKDVTLHLGNLMQDDTTFFNGEVVGITRGFAKPREYQVPGKYVHAGRNVLAVRLVGLRDNEGDRTLTGIAAGADTLRAEVGGVVISMNGTWRYKPGADRRDMPLPDPAVIEAHPSLAAAPTVLFNAMIGPLTRFRLRGVIWYQGEANVERADQYRALFQALISGWRRRWGYEFPFLFVQLAGFGPELAASEECHWAELREAQAAALSLPNTSMASAIDIGDATDIHPKNKQDVAHRLALAAMTVSYGEDVVHSGPTFRSARIEGNRVRVEFSNPGSEIVIRDRYGYVRGFEIAAADGKFVWARGERIGPYIELFSENVREPAHVRYDWGNTPEGSVFNSAGLPAAPFRSRVPAP